MSSSRAVTQILVELAEGRRPVPEALNLLYPVVYQELRRLARTLMRSQPAGHTLSPTALVHEAYLRLVDQQSVSSQSRTQFFSLAAKAMRSVLVDHARRRAALKRGGGWCRITLSELPGEPDVGLEILALHRALDDLAANDDRMARVVELRVFGGLTVAETADAIGVSKRTIDNDWRVAKAWLSDRIVPESEP